MVVSLYTTAVMCWFSVCWGHGTDVPRAGMCTVGSVVSGSRVHTSHSWTSRLLTSSFSLGVSSLFCRATRCMRDV